MGVSSFESPSVVCNVLDMNPIEALQQNIRLCLTTQAWMCVKKNTPSAGMAGLSGEGSGQKAAYKLLFMQLMTHTRAG
jgi:hypothetical protein